MGVPELVVFLNKVDLLGSGDAELQELVEMEVGHISESTVGDSKPPRYHSCYDCGSRATFFLASHIFLSAVLDKIS